MTATPLPPNPPPGPRRPPRKASSKRWITYLGAALVVALLATGLRPQPAPVEIAVAATGPLRATVNEEGKTRIRQRFVVSAPVAGQLRRLPYKAGAEVRSNATIVATIDPISPTPLDARTRSVAEARRDSAAANLAKAREAHRFATTDLHRFERLFKEGTVSNQELENFQWRETAAAKEVTAAESSLRHAEAELAEFASGTLRPATNPDTAAPSNSGAPPPVVPLEVLAPANGRILRIFEENARVVAAGTPLLEVGDPTDLEVVIEVLSRDGAAIQPNARIEFDQWGGNAKLEGQVRYVEPAAFTKVSALGVEEQRVRIVADLLSPAADRPGLGDNFRVEAHIAVWETPSALKLPSGAFFRRGTNWAVFVLQNGRAAQREVKTGQSSGIETQILDGVKEGEEVILYPGDRIRENQRVRAVKLSP